MQYDSEERPWTEAEWERFLQVSEARSARYGELLETLMDNPDRDELIAREMGWDMDDDLDGTELEYPLVDDSELELPDPESPFADEDELPAEGPDEDGIPRKPNVRTIEAYRRAFTWGERMLAFVQRFNETDPGSLPLPEDPDEILQTAALGSTSVAAKIAAGHGMGYEDEVLCGNIICCRKALACADEALEALNSLVAFGLASERDIRPLLEQGQSVRLLVEERIVELRSRVWWE
jgi:hypothetical protein